MSERQSTVFCVVVVAFTVEYIFPGHLDHRSEALGLTKRIANVVKIRGIIHLIDANKSTGRHSRKQRRHQVPFVSLEYVTFLLKYAMYSSETKGTCEVVATNDSIIATTSNVPLARAAQRKRGAICDHEVSMRLDGRSGARDPSYMRPNTLIPTFLRARRT